MKLAGIRVGDVVEANVKGRQFYAIVERTPGDELIVHPITHGITYRRVSARQVIRHWRQAGRSRPQATAGDPE